MQRAITRIIIHHSASARATTTRALVDQWHRAKGWNGVGYHKVIEADGSVMQGRPDHEAGAHAEGHNYDSLGVLVCGNFHDRIIHPNGSRTPEEYINLPQLEALVQTCATLCKRHGLKPEAILGHRDVNATACPGRNLYPLLPYVRERVAAYLT